MHALSLPAVIDALNGACTGAPVGPSPAISLVLQVSALGAAVGSLVAWRAQQRDADANVWAICTIWALLGLVAGVIVLVVHVVA